MATQQHASPPEHLRKPNDGHVEWLLRRVWERLNVNNEHFMGVIVGEEGSGKSHTALKIAHAVDPTFDADRVIFDVAELLEVLREGEHEPGQMYVLDEAGVQFGVRTWQDRGQVLANQALQLIRDHNLGLIFTLPRLGELDSQAQGRMQAFIEMVDKVNGEYVVAKWKWMDPDRADDTGTIYKKFPRRRQNGQIQRLTRVAFTPPPEEIVEPYEATKDEFQEEFYDEVIQELDDSTDDEEDDELSVQDIAEKIQSNGGIDQYIESNGSQQYIDRDLIEMDYDIGGKKSKKVKKLLKRETGVEAL